MVRVAAPAARDPRFEPHHRQNFSNSANQLHRKDENKQENAGNDPF